MVELMQALAAAGLVAAFGLGCFFVLFGILDPLHTRSAFGLPLNAGSFWIAYLAMAAVGASLCGFHHLAAPYF